MINDGLFQSNKMDWMVPPKLFKKLHEEFQFTIDATASPENAMLPKYWTKEDDCLIQDWSGERVWSNPPYGREQIKFIQKAAECKADIAVLLIPARTDTKVWHEYIFPKAEVRFLKGRIKFFGADNSAPFPSALVIFRKDDA